MSFEKFERSWTLLKSFEYCKNHLIVQFYIFLFVIEFVVYCFLTLLFLAQKAKKIKKEKKNKKYKI